MNTRTKGRITGLALVFAAFVSANAGYSVAPASAGQGDPVIHYDPNDAAMTAAEAQARGTLSAFFARVMDDDGVLQADAGIKVAIPVAGGGEEIIWVSPFARDQGRLSGVLANEPNAIHGKHAGDVILFDEAQVRDWYILGADGRMYGSYTTRVMLDAMPQTQAAQLRALLSDVPLPVDW